MRAQREVRIKKTEGRSRVKVAFFSRLKEIKIPLLSLFYALLFSTRISSRLCAGTFRRERISLNLFFLPSEEEYYIESRRRSTYSRRTFFVLIFLLFVPFFPKRQKKKIRGEKEGFRRAVFPPKKKKNCRKKRPILYHHEWEILGGKRARKHTSLDQ